MGFIPVDQMKKLREAAKNGDARAKAILKAQLDGTDYAFDLEAYFKPAPATKVINNYGGNPGSATEAKATQGTGNPRLDEFLEGNGIHEGDPDYEDALNDYYNEFPEDMPTDWGKPKEEKAEHARVDLPNPEQEAKMEDAARDLGKLLIDVISECDKEMLEIMQDDNIDDNAKKGAMTSLQEIKQNMLDNIDKVRKVKKSFAKDEQTGI